MALFFVSEAKARGLLTRLTYGIDGIDGSAEIGRLGNLRRLRKLRKGYH